MSETKHLQVAANSSQVYRFQGQEELAGSVPCLELLLQEATGAHGDEGIHILNIPW